MVVFYLVDSDPPTAKDFLSFRERSKKNLAPELECQSCGLSVFTDIEATELARTSIRSLRSKKLAKGCLSIDSGKIKNTPSQNTGDTHHTLWLNRNIDPCSLFKVLS
ncbi:MAG: hypothetical protein LH649_06750 [Pseudanabaena sp. CAN_BIN31]|nr:hypothetical protein [Pseudanabaena sp. CAN_BIN31]